MTERQLTVPSFYYYYCNLPVLERLMGAKYNLLCFIFISFDDDDDDDSLKNRFL